MLREGGTSPDISFHTVVCDRNGIDFESFFSVIEYGFLAFYFEKA